MCLQSVPNTYEYVVILCYQKENWLHNVTFAGMSINTTKHCYFGIVKINIQSLKIITYIFLYILLRYAKLNSTTGTKLFCDSKMY